MAQERLKNEELLQAMQKGFSAGQSHVEALISFVKERTALEESYAKSLQKLSKASLLLDGACCVPACSPLSPLSLLPALAQAAPLLACQPLPSLTPSLHFPSSLAQRK